MSQPIKTVAISYAWKEEFGGENAQKVEALCARLRDQGTAVLWDKEGLRLGEDIRDFMRRIGTAEFLCVFLSDAYLRSVNCMNELLIAWENSLNRPDEFKQRAKVWIMPTAKGIFRLEGRLAYTEFWQGECAKLEPLVNKHASRGLHGEDLNQFNRMKQYAEKTNEILAFLSGKLAPRDFGEFETWVCSLLGPGSCALPVQEVQSGLPSPSPLIPAVTAPAPQPLAQREVPADLEPKLQQVFGAQYRQLTAILEKRRELREILVDRFHLRTLPAGQLTPALILEFHRAFLQALGEFGQIMEDDPAQRDAVLELTSSMLFLAMAPEFADALLKEAETQEFRVAEEARQGIAEMLLCWTRRTGRRPVPVAAFSREKQPTAWETTPQMALPEFKRSLMSRLQLDAAQPDAERKLEEELERRANFGHPVMQAVPEDNRELLDAIRRDTRLRHLLLLLKATGNTINAQGGENYDGRFEDHLAELLNVAQPQP